MVPEGWRTERLKALLTGGVKNGYSPVASEHETGFWVLGLGALRDDGLNPREIKPVEPTVRVKGALLSPGDFLVSRSNTPDKVGRSVMYKGEVPNCSYPDLMMRFRVNSESACPEFIEQKLKSSSIRRYFKNSAAGSSGSMVKINKGILENTPINLPPLSEQKKIAQILSTWDQAISTTERLLENSQQRKKGLMQHLLTGKKRLPGFEGEWNQHALSEVAKVIVSPVDKKSDPEEKPVQLCNYTDVYYNTRITKDMPFMEATAKDSEIEKYTLQAGDVVITKDSETPGDIAVPALVAEDLGGVVCGYHLAILRASPSKLSGAFLNCLLSMPRTRYYFFSLATGATRFGLSVGAIHNAEVTLPSVPEQEAIANILTTCDDELEIISERLDRLKQEKKALMQQLLTGKRRVQVDTEAA